MRVAVAPMGAPTCSPRTDGWWPASGRTTWSATSPKARRPRQAPAPPTESVVEDGDGALGAVQRGALGLHLATGRHDAVADQLTVAVVVVRREQLGRQRVAAPVARARL